MRVCGMEFYYYGTLVYFTVSTRVAPSQKLTFSSLLLFYDSELQYSPPYHTSTPYPSRNRLNPQFQNMHFLTHSLSIAYMLFIFPILTSKLNSRPISCHRSE
ncbi:hypothetical protein L873DRAFT_696897 [Choiromyces venosus 120613-1]|uniref:Uncharacterized protein n=1 Tax=Choiromyces venosus 120613-1 TaxID=1336337 RepID=A0A3N4JSD9_9PEZI|nr:hypothetical protein L873DRAFT_696897 [Choiromyces venosus 120613-1]